MSLIVSRFLPGMVSSGSPFILRSNMPGIVAKDTICGTPVVYVYNGTTGLVEAQTVTTANRADGKYIAGIAVRVDTARYRSASAVPAIYEDGEAVTLLTAGDIAVSTEVAVKPGDPVFFRTATNGGFTTINKFTNASDAGTIRITGAVFMIESGVGTVSTINLSGQCYVLLP